MKPLFPVEPMRTLVCFCLMSLLLLSCGPAEEQEQKENAQSTLQESGPQQVTPPPSDAVIDYGQLMDSLFTLQQQIQNNQDDISLRKELVSTALQKEKTVLLAVGEGIPSSEATTMATKRDSARRAALVNAQKWALTMLHWKTDPTTPFLTNGTYTIQGELPPFTVVQRAELFEDTQYVMIEVTLPAGEFPPPKVQESK